MRRLCAILLGLAIVTAGCPAKHECPSGQTDCLTGCRDLQTSADACGGCGVLCPAGASCIAGTCVCPAGQTPCGMACVDLQTDAMHCGACAIECGLGTCSAGACQCAGGATLCPNENPRCADLQGDPRNCGGCGTVCPLTNEACVSGGCACANPFPNACPPASPTACVNLQTDPANCGACDATCTAEGKTACSGGACACASQSLTNCGAAGCFDLATDERHCGSCGTACGGAQTCCSSSCRTLASDALNCGSCGHVCPTGASCGSGTCQCPQGPAPGCGTACCAGGSACCTGNACPPAHANGLGGSYFDCGAQDAHSHEQAQLAAISWNASGTTFEVVPSCPNFCLCRQTATQAAVWCYAGSPVSGFVIVTGSPNCLAAACPFGGNRFLWH